MPGCQAVMPNGKHCRNYSRKNNTCCYSHRYLEEVPAETEIGFVKKAVKKEKCECSYSMLEKVNGEFVWKCPCGLTSESM